MQSNISARQPLSALPTRVGLGLKPQHYRDVLGALERGARVAKPPVVESPATESSLAESPVESPIAESSLTESDTLPAPAWVEIHPQNYFSEGGPPHRWLTAIAEHLPLSFHSVGLSLGSADGVDTQELESLAVLCDRYQPAMVSDHLSWSSIGDHHFPDLLPIPYSYAMLDHFVTQVERVQERLARTILVENPSHYLAYREADMGEVEFLHSLCARSGCGLLLDINNIDVSSFNLGCDSIAWLDAIDPSLVGEVHVAGHARKLGEDGHCMAIDDHSASVSDSCLALTRRFLARAGAKPILLERDSNIPDYATLASEMAHIDAILYHDRISNAVPTVPELADRDMHTDRTAPSPAHSKPSPAQSRKLETVA